MDRMCANLKRVASILAIFMMIFLMVAPPLTTQAATTSDNFVLGDPEFDLVNGFMKYGSAQGYGTTLYRSIVINFTSTCTNGERIEVTPMAGFTYETSLSNDVTVVINMTDGKTLPQIGAFIRRVKFYNCDKANNKIKFSIGADLVHYMTLYSEDTGHYYQYIPFKESEGTLNSTSVKWPEADSEWKYGTWEYSYYRALSMSYEGLQGYMCTLTKPAEDIFLYKNAHKVGWLGGTRMSRGTAATKNGIKYYKSFTPCVATDKGMNYWYWASGPEASMKLGNGTGAEGQLSVGVAMGTSTSLFQSSSFYTDANAKGFYYNWNNNEPNNSGGTEFCMTTLQTGTGKSTAAAIPDGYSWNDIVDTNSAYEGKGTTYTATGFFVEFGDAETGLKAGTTMTGYRFDSSTKPLTHTWQYTQGSASNNDTNTVHAFCTKTGSEKCSYYGTATAYSRTVDVKVNAPDMAYKEGTTYNLASISGATEFKSLTGGTVSTITYYSVSTPGATSGGTLVEAPTKIGYYYAQITATNSGATSTANAVAPFKIYNDLAEVNAEGLNNLLVSTAGESNVSFRVVQSTDTATTDLKVKLGSASDVITLYRLAEMEFNDDGELQPLDWVPAVKKWLAGAGSKYASIASDPAELGSKGSSNKWAEFYGDLAKYLKETDATAANTGITPPEGEEDTYFTDKKIADFLKLAEGTDYDSVSSTSPTRTVDTYSNIKFGTYLVYGTVGGQPYSTTIANVVPEKNGPSGYYYVKPYYEVTIKEITASIEKEIRNVTTDTEFSHGETFDIGDEVEFRVEFVLPEYKDKDSLPATSKDTNGFDTGNGYTLQLKDTMAAGYTTVANGYGEGITYKLQYIYLYDDSGEEKEGIADLPWNTKVTKNKSTTGNATNNVADCLIVKSTPVADPANANIVTVDFDAQAVKAWKTATEGTTISSHEVTGIKAFVLTYKAKTNSNAEVGTDANTNKAEIIYEINGGTGTDRIADTVTGYTYAVNIVKVDGETVEDENPTYLDSTYFKLYKKVASFDATSGSPVATTGLGTDEDTLSEYTAKYVTGKAAAVRYYELENHNIIDGDAVKQVTSFFAPYVNESGMFTPSTDTVMGAGYVLSVASADGKTIKGLGTGQYVLVETRAKQGYNELSEDVYFEINGLNDTEAQINSLTQKSFREALSYGTVFTTTGSAEAIAAAKATATGVLTSYNSYLADPTTNASGKPTYNEGGVVKLTVLNFQGLTLPSTGGMGILIFVIIGIALMVTVIIILIRNYKKLQNNQK